MKTSFWIIAVTAFLAACGDTEEANTNPTSSPTTTNTSTATSSTTGGMGGMGGMGTGGMGGTAGMGGTGGTMVASINGCTDADFMPPADPGNVVITSMLVSYTPKCLLIPAGTDVTFSMNFVIHPLRAGIVVGMTATPDPTSPITDQDMGMNATFNFPNIGDFGYYCLTHYQTDNMIGAIRVQ